MVLLDTNVFVIDRFFPRDERYEVNKRFIAQLTEIASGLTSIVIIAQMEM